jgi:DNA repair exonuclease SbcCD nuclease subunit
MKWLLTSDTHLSDRPKDRYRFGLFDWLATQQERHAVTATFILGDITDKKDNHSALLVNKTVNSLLKLRPPIYLLKGNHDFIDPANPFFEFLNYVDGIEFINEPLFVRQLGVAFLPHQPSQEALDAACDVIPAQIEAVMTHQCYQGAIAETGAALTGLRASPIEAKRPKGIWAGDVHKPQRLSGGVTYVGAPYHKRFGDDFQPRVLLVENGIEQNLYYPSLHKWALTVHDGDEILNNVNLHKGDQVKITIQMTAEEVIEWNQYKQRVLDACKERGVEVFGVRLEITSSRRKSAVKHDSTLKRPDEILEEFCKSEKVAANIKRVGFELLKG